MAPQQGKYEDLTEDDLMSNGNLRKEILYEGRYYDVTDFIGRHPGGSIIEFYTNPQENATLAIQQFHNRSMKKVNAILKSFKSRPASLEEMTLRSEEKETKKRHAELTSDFQKLHAELEAEGYFKGSILHTFYRFAELVILIYLGRNLLGSSYLLIKIFGALLIGILYSRFAYYSHEAGHNSITGIVKVDKFLHVLLIGYGLGLSSEWWCSQHNRHHAFPQRLQHDVDLNTLPLLAFNKKIVKEDSKIGNSFLLRHQSTLFLLVDTFLVSSFWKLFLSPRYAWKKGNYVELLFMLTHYCEAFYYSPIYLYPISVWVLSLALFFNFSLSHSHTPVSDSDKALHWVEYSFLHTIDIEPNLITDWWMGYLNYQIEHHLFPTMPQFRQREVTKRVEAFAIKHNLPYKCLSYFDAAKLTLNNLKHVSQELQMGFM